MSGWENWAGVVVVCLSLGVAVGFWVGNEVARRQKPAEYRAQLEAWETAYEVLNARLNAAQQEAAESRESLRLLWKRDEEIAKILRDNLHALTAAMGNTPRFIRLIEWVSLTAPRE